MRGFLLGSGRFPVLAAEEFELPRPDLDGAVVAALVVLPLAVLELPADADPGALRAVLAEISARRLKAVTLNQCTFLTFSPSLFV